jgi:hypothetical protein
MFSYLLFVCTIGAIIMLLSLALISTLFLSGCSFFRQQPSQPPALQTLINDLKLYTLEHEKTLHAGNLYQHLLWTHYAATRLMEQPSVWTSDGFSFTQRDKELLSLAAFLHDLGKAGRAELFNGNHPSLLYRPIFNNNNKVTSIIFSHDSTEHVQVGFDYFCELFLPFENQRLYTLANAIPMSIQPLMHQLSVMPDEQKVLAILVGMHYDFGMLVAGKFTIEQYLANLNHCAKLVQYQPIDEKLLRLAVLVQVADVTGMSYVAPCKTWLFSKPEDLTEVRTIAPTAYERFEYNTDKPVRMFHELLTAFRDQKV